MTIETGLLLIVSIFVLPVIVYFTAKLGTLGFLMARFQFEQLKGKQNGNATRTGETTEESDFSEKESGGAQERWEKHS